jgi:predicted anti-sigma-YlaC factor YlaD
MKSSHTHSNETWASVQPGQLQSLAQSHARRAQITRVSIAAASGFALVCVAIAATFLLNDIPENSFPLHGGIACQDVDQNYAAYASGELDQKLQSQIAIHLQECVICRNRYRLLGEASGTTGLPPQHETLAQNSQGLRHATANRRDLIALGP